MIKKLIGVLAAAGILAVLVFTVLHRNSYRSMCFGEGTSLLDVFGKSEPAAAPLPPPSPVDVPDEMPVPDAPTSDSTAFDRSVDSVARTETVGSADSVASSGVADRPAEAMQSADSVR